MRIVKIQMRRLIWIFAGRTFEGTFFVVAAKMYAVLYHIAQNKSSIFFLFLKKKKNKNKNKKKKTTYFVVFIRRTSVRVFQ